jgi:RHS repeat-associated protein
MGRFEKIYITNSAQLFQYHYDAASNEIQRDNLYNGVTQLYPRDALNRMLSMDVRNGGSTLGHEGYTYDPMNRLTLVDWANTHTDSFIYYQDGELNQAQYGNFNRSVTFNLDKAGNRTNVTDNVNGNATYTPNNLNQYSYVTGGNIGNGAEHEISAYNNVTYTFINDGRLSSASSGANTYTVAYDALDRCVKRTFDNITTYYIYDGEKPILEYDANGTSVGVNLYGKGIDEILERFAIGADNQWHAYFLQQNHEGSVTHLTDSSGSVIEKYRYDAFGVPTIYAPDWSVRSSTSYDNRFLFAGREYAATYRSTSTGLSFYEYRARAYHPGLGRFMSEDPKLFGAGDYNLFRYCHNDPEDMTDPMGLASEATGLLEGGTNDRVWDQVYNYAMAAAQWRMTTTNLAGGTIAAGMAGQALMQQARREAQSISEGKENRSTAAQALYRPHAKSLASGLAPVDEYQIAYGKAGAERMGDLTDGSMEANVAGGYNMDTQKFGYSGYVKSAPVPGGQIAPTPQLPSNRWALAFQAHGHHGMKPISSPDFHWANVRARPIFVHRADGVSMYVPPAVRIDSTSMLGRVFGPGEF